jgi:hypothetical protein
MPSPSGSAEDGRLQRITPDDGSVLLDFQNDRLLKLSPVCAEIWTSLCAGKVESEITQEIAYKYRVDVERVSRDVRSVIARIQSLHLSPNTSIMSSKKLQSESNRKSEPTFHPYERNGIIDKDHAPKPAIVILAFVSLAAFDVILWLFSFRTLCSYVQAWPIRRVAAATPDITARICNSVQRACTWYPKRTLCLQRSAVTTCLLRIHGVAAQMVIGVRPMPFMAHAWVEVNGAVVNDWPGVKTFYNSLNPTSGQVWA